MALNKSSVKRAVDAAGDEILTLTTAEGEHVQAVAMVDGSGAQLGTAENPARAAMMHQSTVWDEETQQDVPAVVQTGVDHPLPVSGQVDAYITNSDPLPVRARLTDPDGNDIGQTYPLPTEARLMGFNDNPDDQGWYWLRRVGRALLVTFDNAVVKTQVNFTTSFVTPTLDTAQYADGDVLFEPMQVPYSDQIPMLLRKILIVDKDGNGGALDLLFIGPYRSIGDVNDPVDMSGVDLGLVNGLIRVAASDYVQVGAYKVATIMTNLYDPGYGLAGISRDTKTYSADGLYISFAGDR